jgi:hypothetical protein
LVKLLSRDEARLIAATKCALLSQDIGVGPMSLGCAGPWWALGIAVVVGWAVNAWEHRVVRKRIAEMESKRD